MPGTLNDVWFVGMDDQEKALTQNAVAQVVRSFEISPFEGGQFLCHVSAVDKLGNYLNTIKHVRYKKDGNGVLSITAKDVLAIQADTALNTATFAFVVVNGALTMQVTGVAATNIGWVLNWTRTSVSMNNF